MNFYTCLKIIFTNNSHFPIRKTAGIFLFLAVLFPFTAFAGAGNAGKYKSTEIAPFIKYTVDIVKAAYPKANISAPYATYFDQKLYVTGNLYDSLDNPNGKRTLYMVVDSVLKVIKYEDVVDDIPQLAVRLYYSTPQPEYWFSNNPLMVTKNECLFSAPVYDTIYGAPTADSVPQIIFTSPTYFIKYNFDTKHAEIINHPIYDSYCHGTVPYLISKNGLTQNPFNNQVIAFVYNYDLWMNAYNNDNTSSTKEMMCIYDNKAGRFKPAKNCYFDYKSIATNWPRVYALHASSATGYAWIKIDFGSGLSWTKNDSLCIYNFDRDTTFCYGYLTDFSGTRYSGMYDIAADRFANVYALDDNYRLMIVDSNGKASVDTWIEKYLQTYDEKISDIENNFPHMICDDSGNLYVAITGLHNMFVRSMKGEWSILDLREIFDNTDFSVSSSYYYSMGLQYVNHKYVCILDNHLYFNMYDPSANGSSVRDYPKYSTGRMKIYPNPSAGKVLSEISLDSEDFGNLKAGLINQTGIFIKDLTNNIKIDDTHCQIEFDTSTLPAGSYCLILRSGRQFYYNTIIVY